MKIKTLSPEVITKIAAGEVIERPASVLKELLENALDAGAGAITIDLYDGGIKKIVVADDGQGMSADDVAICHLPHTTSKVTKIDDLMGIGSFGFRGEALASIARVSALTIQSRVADARIGHEVSLTKGKRPTPVGMPVGTRVVVASLFSGIPARKKFLKTPRRELAPSLGVATSLALAHPHVAIALNHNHKEVLRLPAHRTLLERLEALYPREVAKGLLPVSITTPYLSVEGYIGVPENTRSNSDRQYLSVNGRVVRDPRIAEVVRRAYGRLIGRRDHPVWVLSLSVPKERIDVNIHPRKEAITFAHHDEVVDLLKSEVEAVLRARPRVGRVSGEDGVVSEQMAELLRGGTVPWDMRTMVLDETPVFQIAHLYLVGQTNNGVLIVDQHAAHERILYEQFFETFETMRKEDSVVLAHPLRLALSADDVVVVEEHRDIFAEIGCAITVTEEGICEVTAMPRLFVGQSLETVFGEVIADLREGAPVAELDTLSERTVLYLACRSAVKAGDTLSEAEGRELIKKLFATNNYQTCPHGRPTHWLITKKELDHFFRR